MWELTWPVACCFALGAACATKMAAQTVDALPLEVSRFGTAIEILPRTNGRSPTLVVGDSWPRDDGVQGRVAYFELSSGKFLWANGNPTSVAGFGSCMSRIGDINRDGFDDLLIGSYCDRTVGTVRAACVVSGSSTEVLRTHVVDTAVARSWFGDRVARLGDINRDGVDDYAISDPGDPYYGLRDQRGIVFAYSGETGKQLWIARGSDHDERFGVSVVGSADHDGDGVADVLVGSSVPLPNEGYRASLHCVSGATGKNIRTYELAPPRGSRAEAICILGDVDGLGMNDIAIGCPDYGVDRHSRSDVICISAENGTQLFSVRSPSVDPAKRVSDDDDTDFDEKFGSVLCVLPDLNGDHKPDIAAGHRERSLCIFIDGATGLELGRIHKRGKMLGWAIALGPVDDSKCTLAVSASTWIGAVEECAVWIFELERNGPLPVRVLGERWIPAR
jgi:hypothetical protein